MRVTIVLENERSIKEVIACCETSMAFEKPHAVTIAPVQTDRSIRQNSISHAWYSEVAKVEGEYTPGEVKCLCKFHIALPILRGADSDFNELCIEMIDPLPYQLKIKAMDFFNVTKKLSTKQMSLFLKSVQANYSGRVNLTFPGDYRN